jgi:hypothetical protein
MTITVKDVEDFVQVLKEHPEWRQRVVQVLLDDELLDMPAAVRRFFEEMQLLKAEMKALTARVDRLELQMNEQFDQVNERINRFEQRTDERFRQVDERFDRIEQRLDNQDNQIGMLIGESMESRYRNHIGAFFGRVLKRARVVSLHSLEEELETRLSDDEIVELLLLDLLARGNLKSHPERPTIWLALEISATINTNDVTRARQRADLLNKAGYPTLAIAGGKACSRDAAELAQQTKVVIVQDGGEMSGWDAALATIR